MEIRYSKAARKALESYDRPTKQRIRTAILGLTEKPPKGDIKRMEGFTDGRLRLRVGGYRIIFRYDHDGQIEILQIINIDSRGGVYK